MADTIHIATLKDSKAKIEQILERIKKNLQKFDNLDPSEQDKVSNQIYTDFKYANNELEGMKMEVSNIQAEMSQKAFKDQISILKQEVKKVQDEFTNKQNNKKTLNNLLVPDDINVKLKGNNELTVQEAINKGNNILAEDRAGINRMNKVIKQDIDIAKQIEQDLEVQNQKLSQTEKDLKEIDYSLNRAGKQLKTMFKMYATDKLIMCMIVVIVLVIIAIIIVGAVGGDKEGKFNVPHDLFTSSSTTSTTSTTGTTTPGTTTKTSRILFLK
jgi:hypothetical protein